MEKTYREMFTLWEGLDEFGQENGGNGRSELKTSVSERKGDYLDGSFLEPLADNKRMVGR